LVFAVGAAATIWSGVSFWHVAVSSLLVLNIVFVTSGRIGYLAVVILAGVLGLARSVAGAIVLLACLGLLVASPQVRERVALGISEMRNYANSPVLTSMGWRMVMWSNTLEIVRERSIFGVGTGSFEAAYRQKIASHHGWQAEPTNDPHNFYLKVLAEQGVAGLLTFLAFLVFVAVAKSPFRELHWGVLVTFCAANLFASDFSRFIEGRFMFLWLGVMLAGAPVKTHPGQLGVRGYR
jgi:O-antigen ligase